MKLVSQRFHKGFTKVSQRFHKSFTKVFYKDFLQKIFYRSFYKNLITNSFGYFNKRLMDFL